MENKYKNYFEHPATRRVLDQLQILEHEAGLLWLVDAAFFAPLPLSWEFTEQKHVSMYWRPPDISPAPTHPFDRYIKDVGSKLRTGAGNFAPNTIQYHMSLNPPAVVKDILMMCGYLNIDPQGGMVWLAMAALCCNLNYNYYISQERCYATGISSQHSEENSIDGTQQIPLTLYYNIQTGEPTSVFPSDNEFGRLAETEPASDGQCIIPKLTKAEASLLLPNQVIVYDFRTLTVNVIENSQIHLIKRVHVPNLAAYHSQRGEKRLFETFMEQNPNIKDALDAANEIVFSGRPQLDREYLQQDAERKAKQSLDGSDLAMSALEELDPCVRIENPAEYARKNFVETALPQRTANMHYQDLTECPSLIPAKVIPHVGMDVQVFTPQSVFEPEFLVNPKNRRCRPYRTREMPRLFRDSEYLNRLLSQQLSQAELQRRIQQYKVERDLVNYMLEIQTSGKATQGVSRSKMIAQGVPINRALNDDNILQQILEPPPAQSRFHAELYIPRLEARQIHEYVAKVPFGQSPTQIDQLVVQLYKQHFSSQEGVRLILAVTISYPDEFSRDVVQSGREGRFNELKAPADRTVKKPTAILTEALIKYEVNDVPFEPQNVTEYRETICDFYLGRVVQIGRYSFTVSRVDSVTKRWLLEGFTKLNYMISRLEKDLIMAGEAALVAQTKRVNFQTIENCAISLRQMGQRLLFLFERYTQLHPEAKLARYE